MRRARIAVALAAALSLGGCLVPVENIAVGVVLPELVDAVLTSKASKPPEDPDPDPDQKEEP